jgi:6,7-dimethyl-8-ribityllumazine synthase
MLKPLPPRPDCSPEAVHRFVIVASRYNEEFVQPMVEKAITEITTVEPNSKVEVIPAPGSFEIPFLARLAIERNKPDAVICLGVIFEGKTGHADLIAACVSDSLCRMAVETLTPVIHGVLLLENEDQARERCLGHEINRGTEGARAAIEALRAAHAITTI